jgi:TRAP-type C4-dicarboxylate transport system permease large subunit
MITPPFGVNLFAACTVARISLDQIVKHLLPFVLVIIGCLMVVTYVPPLSLALRDIVFHKAPAAAPSPGPAPSIGPQ